MEALALGDVTVTVTVTASSGVFQKKYVLKIKETLTMGIYLDEFWTNPSLDKIRYTFSALPENTSSVAVNIRDSLAIDAECRWRDVASGIYDEQVETITYEMESAVQDKAYAEECCIIIRDFGPAIEHFGNNYVMGSEFVGDTDEIGDMKYEYYPTSARYFLDICLSDPFYDVAFFMLGNAVVTDGNDISIKKYEDLENDKIAMEHYNVSFMSTLSDEEIEATRSKLKKILAELGMMDEDDEIWDRMFDGMTEEEIEEFIDRIYDENE